MSKKRRDVVAAAASAASGSAAAASVSAGDRDAPSAAAASAASAAVSLVIEPQVNSLTVEHGSASNSPPVRTSISLDDNDGLQPMDICDDDGSAPLVSAALCVNNSTVLSPPCSRQHAAISLSSDSDDEQQELAKRQEDNPVYPVFARSIPDPLLATSQACSAQTKQAYHEFSELLAADPTTCIEKFKGSFFNLSKSANHYGQSFRSGVLIIESLGILQFFLQTRWDSANRSATVPPINKSGKQNAHAGWAQFLIENLSSIKSSRQFSDREC